MFFVGALLAVLMAEQAPQIGKMGCLSPRFVALLRELLDSDRTVVATVALKGAGFIAEVKGRRDCRVVEMSPGEREMPPNILCRTLKHPPG
jgi:nucleoside-triphosphatase THEP1